MERRSGLAVLIGDVLMWPVGLCAVAADGEGRAVCWRSMAVTCILCCFCGTAVATAVPPTPRPRRPTGEAARLLGDTPPRRDSCTRSLLAVGPLVGREYIVDSVCVGGVGGWWCCCVSLHLGASWMKHGTKVALSPSARKASSSLPLCMWTKHVSYVAAWCRYVRGVCIALPRGKCRPVATSKQRSYAVL